MARRNSFINELLALVVASILLAGFGYFMSHNKPQENESGGKDKNLLNQPFQTTENSKLEPILNKKILYLLKQNNHNNIFSINIYDRSTKIIYTDKDESKKIISIIGNDNENLYIIESNDINSQAGDLVSVSLDGKARKNKLQSDILTAPKPSYDGLTKEILSTSFTQVEKDFGFTLSISKLNSSNKRVVQSKIENLINPTFSNNYENITYSKSVGNDRYMVTVDKNGNLLNEAKIEGIPLSISAIDDKIYVTIAPFGNATANEAKPTVLSLDLTKVNLELPNKDGIETDFKKIDKNIIGYKRSRSQSGINTEYELGKLYLYDIISKEENEIVSANYLIGVTE